MKLMSSQPMTSDTIDELRSRRRRQDVEEYDVNMVTVELTQTEIDSIDKSRN